VSERQNQTSKPINICNEKKCPQQIIRQRLLITKNILYNKQTDNHISDIDLLDQFIDQMTPSKENQIVSQNELESSSQDLISRHAPDNRINVFEEERGLSTQEQMSPLNVMSIANCNTSNMNDKTQDTNAITTTNNHDNQSTNIIHNIHNIHNNIHNNNNNNNNNTHNHNHNHNNNNNNQSTNTKITNNNILTTYSENIEIGPLWKYLNCEIEMDTQQIFDYFRKVTHINTTIKNFDLITIIIIR
jgi:hypothetical protein